MSTGNPQSATAPGETLSDLATLLEPRSVAVIGASDQPGNLGGRAVRLLRKFKFPGPIWPVNPRRATVAELPCYRSLHELPGRADLAIIAVAAPSVASVIDECVQAGIGCGIVWAAGFAEVGGEGPLRQRQLVEVCGRTGFRLCGPNSIGIINSWLPMTGSFASSLVAAERLIPGSVSMVSQSGGIGTAALALAQNAGFGFRYLISTGNEAVLTTADFLAALAEDSDTKVIAVYLEGLRDGPAFIAAMEKAAAARKPVVIIKAGSSAASARAATAHTGALAGEDRVWQAILREQAAITVESNRELLDVALFLSSIDRARLPQGNRVAIVTFGGGGGVLSADLCARYGLETPTISQATMDRLNPIVPPIASVANPIDLTPDMFQPEWLPQFFHALDTIAADAKVDMVFLPLSAMARGASEVARAILDFCRSTHKTVCVSWTLAPQDGINVLSEGGMYVFPEPSSAIRALGKIASYARAAVRKCGAVGLRSFDWSAFVPQSLPGTVASEDVCHRMLAAAGLSVAEGRLAMSEDDAIEAACTVGFPVALKGISPVVTHKAAAGLVTLDLRCEQEVREAYRRITFHARATGVSVNGLYVQHMIEGGLELLVSAFRDPVFGVMVTCGAGGRMAEILDDVTIERAPFDRAQAARVLDRLRVVRGASRLDASADVDAAAEFVARFSELAATAPWRSFVLEVNPIKWLAKTAIAVDGLLIVEQE